MMRSIFIIYLQNFNYFLQYNISYYIIKMSSTTNIPINTRSMNGIITISDGVATMENGNLTDINSLDATK